MASRWIFPAVIFGIISLVLGRNETSTLTNYKPTTAEPFLQTSIKPSLPFISSIISPTPSPAFETSWPATRSTTDRPFGSISTNVLPSYSSWTLSSKSKVALDSIQTHTSISSHVALPFISTISSISLDMTETLSTETTTSVTTRQTAGLPPGSPSPSPSPSPVLWPFGSVSTNVLPSYPSWTSSLSSSPSSSLLLSSSSSSSFSSSSSSSSLSSSSLLSSSLSLSSPSSASSSLSKPSSYTSPSFSQSPSPVFVRISLATRSTTRSITTNVLRSYSSWTSSSKTTLDSIQTQTSTSSHAALPFTSTTSSIRLETTFSTEPATPVATTQTAGPPPGSLQQFEGHMVLKMTWLPQYEHSNTTEFQALASKISRNLTTVLKSLDGFLSVQVLRLRQGSVGVDFIVFARKRAQLNETVVEQRLIEANNTGVLDLPLKNIQVKEKGTTKTVGSLSSSSLLSSSSSSSSSLPSLSPSSSSSSISSSSSSSSSTSSSSSSTTTTSSLSLTSPLARSSPLVSSSSPTVVINKSSLHTKTQIVTKRSMSNFQDLQTDSTSIQVTSTIILERTVSLKLGSLTSTKSYSTKTVSSQSTPQSSNTLGSNQGNGVSSEVYFTITDTPAGVSKNQTTRNNVTNIMSLQRTMTLESLTETILQSLHTTGVEGSFSLTPLADNTSIMSLSIPGNGSSSLQNFTKESESLPTSAKTSVFFIASTTLPRTELSTGYNMSKVSKTLHVTETLKLSNNVSRVSVPTSTIPTAQNITSVINTITSSGDLPVIDTTRSYSMGSSLPSATMMTTITYFASKMTLSSKIYKTTDVLSNVVVTVPPNVTKVPSLPNSLIKNSRLEMITSFKMFKTTDAFPEVHATRMNASTGSSLPAILNKTSSIPMYTSSHSFESASIFSEPKPSSNSASGNKVTSIYKTEEKAASVSVAHSTEFTFKESRSRQINDTVSYSSDEHASNTLPNTHYVLTTRAALVFSSSVEETKRKISASNITTVGSTLETLTAVTSGRTSNIRSTMFQSSDSVDNSPTAKSTSSAQVFITTTPSTRSTADSGSRLRSQTLTPVFSFLSFVASSDAFETFLLTTQKQSQVVTVIMKDKTSTLDYATIAPSPSNKSNLSSTAGVASASTIKQKQTSSLPSSTLRSLADTKRTSAVQNTYDSSGPSLVEKFSRAYVSLNSTQISVQFLYTSMTKGIMPSFSSLATLQVLTTALVHSTRVLIPMSVHPTHTLNFLPSATQSKPIGNVTYTGTTSQGTPHTYTTRKQNSANQSSHIVSSELQKTASADARLSATATTLGLSSAATNRSKSAMSLFIESPFTTITSLFFSHNSTTDTGVLSSQTIASSNTTSTDSIIGFSSIKDHLERQSSLVSSTGNSTFRSSPSSALTPLKSSNGIVLTSTLVTSSWSNEITEVSTVASPIFETSSPAIRSTTDRPFGSISTSVLHSYSSLTLASKNKVTLDIIPTQTSISPHVTLPFIGTISSISLDTTETPTIAPVTTVSVLIQSAVPPPESPNQFEGRMVLQMTWLPQYEYSYTPEFQALETTIKRKLTTALQTLDGFLSVQVLRLWQSSVGVDFIVFARKTAQVNETVVENQLIEANNTGVLDLPLTSIQVKEKETTTAPSLPTTSSTNEDKSIERWVIILIVAAILVFLLVLIICILVVKLTKQHGGVRRSRKYQVSTANNYLNYLYTEHPVSKPVILRMEERNMEAKKSHSFDGIMNSNGEQRLSHKEGRVPSKDSNYEWVNSSSDPTTSNNFISSMEKKHVKEEEEEEEATVGIYDTVDSNSKENRSPYEDRITGRTGNACIHNSTSEHSKDSIISNTVTSPLNEPNQNSREKINSSNESNEATTSSSSVSLAIEKKTISTDDKSARQNQGYRDEEKL